MGSIAEMIDVNSASDITVLKDFDEVDSALFTVPGVGGHRTVDTETSISRNSLKHDLLPCEILVAVCRSVYFAKTRGEEDGVLSVVDASNFLDLVFADIIEVIRVALQVNQQDFIANLHTTDTAPDGCTRFTQTLHDEVNGIGKQSPRLGVRVDIVRAIDGDVPVFTGAKVAREGVNTT